MFSAHLFLEIVTSCLVESGPDRIPVKGGEERVHETVTVIRGPGLMS